MNRERYVHIMEMMVNLDDINGSEELFPVVFGYNNISEIYSFNDSVWYDYREMEDNVFSLECLALNPEDGFYYTVRENYLTRIDVSTGESFQIEEMPELLGQPGKCSIVEIGGMPGLMTRMGFWYNLK